MIPLMRFSSGNSGARLLVGLYCIAVEEVEVAVGVAVGGGESMEDDVVELTEFDEFLLPVQLLLFS